MTSHKEYNIAEAARKTGLHKNTIRRYIKKGMVRATKVRGIYGEEYSITEGELDKLGIPKVKGDSEGFGEGAGIPKTASLGRGPEGFDINKWLERYEQAMVRVGQAESQRLMLEEDEGTLFRY